MAGALVCGEEWFRLANHEWGEVAGGEVFVPGEFTGVDGVDETVCELGVLHTFVTELEGKFLFRIDHRLGVEEAPAGFELWHA